MAGRRPVGYAAAMPPSPVPQIARLREIGWHLWDPMELADPDGNWDDHCADAYDSYLLNVVSQLQDGWPAARAAAHLDWIRAEWMGLGAPTAQSLAASRATVAAIAAYLESLAGGD